MSIPIMLNVKCTMKFFHPAALVLLAAAAHGTDMAAELRGITQSVHLQGGRFGLVVRDVTTGRDVIAVNPGLPLKPASNQKLLVTAAALAELGPDFRFETGLYVTGPVVKGELQGDLILRGGGDPNLSGRFHNGDVLFAVREWVAAVRKAGITAVRGRLLIDDSLFDRQFFHPSWPAAQAARWYAAEIGALSLNDNCIDLTIRPGAAPGEPVRWSFEPFTRYIGIQNGCKTGVGKSAGNILVSRTDTTVVLGGNIGVGATGGFFTNVPVHDPGLFTGAVFGRLLAEAGITVQAVARVEPPPDYRELLVIGTFPGEDLRTTVRVTNSRSQNFYAEMLVKYLSARKTGQGSFAGGTLAVQTVLTARGLAWDGIRMDDACGLSHQNRIAAGHFVDLLSLMLKTPAGDAFVTSLAMPGDPDGTLRKHLRGVALNGKVYAKSGYIDGVKAISGYAFRADNRVLVFSFIVNDYGGQAGGPINTLQDRLMAALVNLPLAP